MDDPHTPPETSLPPPRDAGKLPSGMSAEEHQEWMRHTRLRDLAFAEAKAWKRFAWGMGIYSGLLLLFLLGIWLGGSPLYRPAKPVHDGALGFVVMAVRGISGIFLFLLAVPLLLRFVRWVEAMWRRRRFSSTPGANPGQPPPR